MIVAVLGVLAVVIGVTVGLVITSGDESESADAADSPNDGTSDDGDSSEDASHSGDAGSDTEPTFSEDFSFTPNNGGDTFAPGETIVITPSYGDTSGIDLVELFVDGQLEGTFAPGEEISTSLPAGRHRLRLIVQPDDGPQVLSDLQRIVVEEPVLGNPGVPANLRAIANGYSDALANNNWARAQQINPGIAGRNFEAEWGDIDRQFVVPVAASGNVLRLGLVVHQFYNIETGGGGPRTSVYCNVWTINPDAGTITATAAGPDPGIPPQPGYADEVALAERLEGIC